MTHQDIAFFLVPGFSMMALSAASEPLRSANRVLGREAYRLSLLSVDGGPVKASSGFTMVANASIDDAPAPALAVVVSSLDVAAYRDPKVFGWLRRLARDGRRLGAVSAGTLLLARAGLMSGRRCTIHWELQAGFAEEFPEIGITRDLFCIDSDRLTCAGGTSALDLMLAMIAEQHGATVAADVAEQFLHTRIRPPSESQRMAVEWRYGITDRRLARAITLMEEHTGHPLTTRALAHFAGISPRQLERLFVRQFGRVPSRFYLELRLRQAQLMLLQSTEPIARIAARFGFASASHFGRCYRDVFKETPGQFRRSRGQTGRPTAEPVRG